MLQAPIPRQALISKFVAPQWRCCLAASVAIATSLGQAPPGWAQVVPDSTLGAEASRVVPLDFIQGDPVFWQVEGGAERGQNLFHSFSELSLAAGEQLFFAPADSVERIFARVTGAQASNIDGRLGVFGEADLFLSNPQGLLFGPNAVLDVAGSFVGTAADGFSFNDGSLFRSQPGPDDVLPLLNVQPTALLFDVPAADVAPERGLIYNRVAADRPGELFGGLTVLPGESLLLVGRSLLFDDGAVLMEGGRIELGAVAGEGAIAFDPQTYALTFPSELALGDITLRNNAQVISNDGGTIRLHGGNITLDRSANSPDVAVRLASFTQSGQIEIVAQSTLDVLGNTGIESATEEPAGPDINIRAGRIVVRDGGSIIASTFRGGAAGNLNLLATESIEVFGATDNGFSGLGARTTSAGRGGDVTLTAPRLSIRDGGSVSTVALDESTARAGNLTVNTDTVEVVGTTFTDRLFFSLLRTETFGPGDAGDLTINARTVTAKDGGTITTRAFGAATGQTQSAGGAGALTINATESIVVEGESPDAPFVPGNIISETTAAGNAGPIQLNTPRLIVRGGGFISSAAEPGSTGQGGDVTVNASEQVEITGRARALSGSTGAIQRSQVTSQTAGTGNAGNIQINTPQLNVTQGGRVTAAAETAAQGGNIELRQLQRLTVGGGSQIQAIATDSEGQAGSLIVEAQQIDLSDQSSLSVEATNGGTAGSLQVQAQQIALERDSQFNVSSPSGVAGSLDIRSDRLTLNGSRLNAETGQNNPSGRGAEIAVSLLDSGGILLLRNGAQITASANDSAQGGNLRLDSQFIVAVPRENSDIRANAVRGQGGNVAIVSDRLFGIEPASQPLLRSDITASSELGAPGSVAITTLALDPSRGLTALPTDLLDGDDALDRSCAQEGLGKGNRFVVTGRGGIPLGPYEPDAAGGIRVWAESAWLPLPAAAASQSRQQRSANGAIAQAAGRFLEASAWQRGMDGQVELLGTAIASAPQPHCAQNS